MSVDRDSIVSTHELEAVHEHIIGVRGRMVRGVHSSRRTVYTSSKDKLTPDVLASIVILASSIEELSDPGALSGSYQRNFAETGDAVDAWRKTAQDTLQSYCRINGKQEPLVVREVEIAINAVGDVLRDMLDDSRYKPSFVESKGTFCTSQSPHLWEEAEICPAPSIARRWLVAAHTLVEQYTK